MLLTHLGAEKTVTGSCHLLQVKGLNILVDCGLAQGEDRNLPIEEWPLPCAEIDFLFLTHAHIDHIGRVPELIRNGFRGEIITTHATKALLSPMLQDAMSFQDMDKGERNKILRSIDELSWGFEYQQKFDLKNGVRFSLGRAGHILGSCFIRLEWDSPSYSVVFSGDVGARNTPLVPDPDTPDSCDFLVLESTYGNRRHEDRKDRIRKLGEVLTHALADGGKVFIPAFALGRVQELLFEMDRLFSDPKWQEVFSGLQGKSPVPVFLDSPLGLRITEIMSGLSPYWDKEAQRILRKGDHPLDFDHLYAVRSFHEHMKLLEMDGPAVIIAGSGMCSGGRIVDHLKTGLKDPRNDVLFVGYQAGGTPGRDILRYCNDPDGFVRLDGESVPIKAQVHVLSGYSAHADQDGLVEWVQSMPKKPEQIKLVHGDPAAQEALSICLGAGEEKEVSSKR
jgi:metallo-beta-lactamase family protein